MIQLASHEEEQLLGPTEDKELAIRNVSANETRKLLVR